MKPDTLNKLLNYLLLYFIVLVVITGIFGDDIVGDMVIIAMLYGIPLSIFIVLYMVTVALEIHAYIKTKNIHVGVIGVASIKMCLAIAPMFFFDNTLASLLALMRV